jgi:hypothetical protein
MDEAHSIGAVGPHGKGVCDFHNVDPNDIAMLLILHCTRNTTTHGLVDVHNSTLQIFSWVHLPNRSVPWEDM